MRTEQMTTRRQVDDQSAAQGLLWVCREANAPAKAAEEVVERVIASTARQTRVFSAHAKS